MLYHQTLGFSFFPVYFMTHSIVGYLLFLLAAVLLGGRKNLCNSKNSAIVLSGVLFQIALLLAMTHLPVVVNALEGVASGVMKLKDATLKGTEFVFGYIGGGATPFEVKNPNSMFVLAFQALPTVILVATLGAILTYLNVIPFIAKIVGYPFKLIFKIKDSMGMVSASKIFLGQLEAPLLIKSQLENLSQSNIFILLTLAFATSSAAVTPIYASALQEIFPNAMQHIIMSSVLNVISVLILSSIVMPREEDSIRQTHEEIKPYTNFMNAMSKGLGDGMFVWWCIVGSLIGMVALITFANYLFALFPDIGGTPITLQRICGIIVYPFAWLIGIESKDLIPVSQIIGTKIVLNEIIAFFDLAKAGVSNASVVKTIYAINNFGNFACIGITVSGLLALAPSQKCITRLVWKAFLTGILATGLTSSLISVFLPL